jgi:hypothetical protein
MGVSVVSYLPNQALYFQQTGVNFSDVLRNSNNASNQEIFQTNPMLTACQPSSDSHHHSGSSPPPHSQHPPPPLHPPVLKPQDSPARHLTGFHFPTPSISSSPCMFPSSSQKVTYLSFPSTRLLLRRISDIRIKSRFLLPSGPVISPGFRVLGCFRVDAVPVLAVFAWES